MNYLGIDYGQRRVGLSYADELAIAFALPAAKTSSFDELVVCIQKLVEQKKIDAFVVGWPLSMDGSENPKTKEVDSFIEKLKIVFNLPVYKSDERLTTDYVQSQRKAFKLDKKKSIQSQIRSRKTGEVDSQVAALILQEFIDQQS